MRFLQDLVPGCNKITGKAGMLDEIINYVQSLQRQVEVKENQETIVLYVIDVVARNFMIEILYLTIHYHDSSYP